MDEDAEVTPGERAKAKRICRNVRRMRNDEDLTQDELADLEQALLEPDRF